MVSKSSPKQYPYLNDHECQIWLSMFGFVPIYMSIDSKMKLSLVRPYKTNSASCHLTSSFNVKVMSVEWPVNWQNNSDEKGSSHEKSLVREAVKRYWRVNETKMIAIIVKSVEIVLQWKDTCEVLMRNSFAIRKRKQIAGKSLHIMPVRWHAHWMQGGKQPNRDEVTSGVLSSWRQHRNISKYFRLRKQPPRRCAYPLAKLPIVLILLRRIEGTKKSLSFYWEAETGMP